MRPHSLAQHRHAHVFLGASHEHNRQRTEWVVALTLAMMVAEIVAGYLFGSMALLADGWHMGTHAGALGISAWAYRYARRHAQDPRYSFGTGKVGDLAGFASALLLLVVALGIGIESGERLLSPQRIAYDEALLVAVIGLGVNLVSAWLLGGDHGHEHEHAHDHAHEHEHHHDHNLQSAYLHVLADALTSVLAILALLAGRAWGLPWLDAAAGLLGAAVIARWSWGLLRQTSAVLLDAGADTGLADRVRALLEQGDDRVADLHLWRVGPGQYACIVALVSAQPRTADEYRERLRSLRELVHVTVETQSCAGPHEPGETPHAHRH